MEQDRYQKNHLLFILGMFSLIMSLSLFCFCVFILPNLLFGATYDIPTFIGYWTDWLQEQYGIGDVAAARLVLLFFIVLTILFVFIAYLSSNRIDNQIYSDELKSARDSRPLKTNRGSVFLFFKILITVALVFVAAVFLEWLIYMPPS